MNKDLDVAETQKTKLETMTEHLILNIKLENKSKSYTNKANTKAKFKGGMR